jgi:DNA-binding CsgD family transcriptional regulator
MPVTPLIGREDELDLVEAFLDAVAQGPCALVLSGEPGIGKTVLWEVGVEDARGRCGQVLTCRGVEAEASLSFAGLSELLGDVLDEFGSSLAAPRRRALEVALLLAEPGETPLDPHAVGLAVLDVIRAAAEQGSVLIALDDVQWLDPASAGAIQIALRRLREEPLGLFATLRLGSELGSPLELERSFPDERLQRLTLGPLSLGALHRLLEEQLSLDLTRPELARVQEATTGNPFFALELGRELVRTDARLQSGQPLRVPASLHELLGGRLARLPGETLDVLLLAAALARPTVELLATTYGERERVIEALETATQESVIELEDSQVRFAHPLLASICYERAPVWKRRSVHSALAGSVSDVEERARHLALAADGPDEAVAVELDAAAEHAAGRGATAAAAELCELAAELTRDDIVLARRRLLRAADFHRLAGAGERAAALLEHLLTEVPTGAERCDVLFALALTRKAEPSRLVELCSDALVEAAGDDARSARILALRSWVSLMVGDVRVALSDGRAALETAERVGDPVLLATAIAEVGRAEGWGAEITPGLLERGIEIEEQLGLELEYNQSPRTALARHLMRVGETERARAVFEDMQAKAAERGDERSRGLILGRLGILEWSAGRLPLALDHAAAAVELAEQTAPQHTVGVHEGIEALVEADLGLVSEARKSAERALAVADVADDMVTLPALGVLGRIELALGNPEAAGVYLRDLPDRLTMRGWNDPTVPAWADAIETLIALGELKHARGHLEQYDANAQRLGSPWAISIAGRCRGLLAAAEGEQNAAFEAFDRALVELDSCPYPLERGRALLSLGTVRRQTQQKRAARDALEQAFTIFDERGARLWAEKARAELARISGRAPASEELTETERRVAELAAQGRTNKEIAAELYMGVSTVESHLSHVYRKLDVRRAGLGARLVEATET